MPRSGSRRLIGLLSLALLAGLYSFTGAAAQPAGGKATRVTVERLVRDWLRAWEVNDERLFRSIIHPNLMFAYPGKREDHAASLASYAEFHQSFENTRVYIHQILVDGNRFMVEYQFASTRKATGKRQAAGTIAIGEVRDGRLYIVKEYLDGRVSRMQEAGQLPVDEGAEPFPWPLVPTPASE
jgi:ketosteroid isomerase-like protein